MFNEEELKLLNSITEDFSRRAKHAILENFNEFMGDLYMFLDTVEKGYTMTIDDYTNDVSKRHLADDLLDQLPPTLKKKVKELIKSWDERYKEATNELQEPLFEEPEWYWYRIPKKLVGDLKEDVESLHIK